MWRQTIARIISGSGSVGKTIINRDLSARTPTLRACGKNGTNNSKRKLPCPQALGKKKKSPCAGVTTQRNNPCIRNTPAMPAPLNNVPAKPCPPVNKPCEAEKPCNGTNSTGRTTPCPPNKTSASNDKTNDYSQNMCEHHREFVPPTSVLSQLKGFELKSTCTSFHMKSSGHEEQKDQPCSPALGRKKSPCAGAVSHYNVAEKPKTPCPPKKTGECNDVPINDHSEKAKNDMCEHHRELVPPMSVLSELKGFELKSTCTSFHMLSSGHEEQKKDQPCSPALGRKKSPCAGAVSHYNVAEKPSTPCPPKKTSACNDVTNDHSEKGKNDMCEHHRELVPPMSVLSQLKGFELKSTCTSFHMLSSGHEEQN